MKRRGLGDASRLFAAGSPDSPKRIYPRLFAWKASQPTGLALPLKKCTGCQHKQFVKRFISASSSAIHEAICSRENLRGGGSVTPDRRKRVARNRMSSCFCSG